MTNRKPHTVANRFFALAFAGLCLMLPMGCNHEPPYPFVHLAGEVKIAGDPVDQGALTFFPIGNTSGPVVGAEILAGKYDCPHVPKGKVLVQFQATKPTGKLDRVGGKEFPIVKGIVPDKYKSGMRLDAEADNLAQHFTLN